MWGRYLVLGYATVTMRPASASRDAEALLAGIIPSPLWPDWIGEPCDPISNWTGVTCDNRTQRVIGLDLRCVDNAGDFCVTNNLSNIVEGDAVGSGSYSGSGSGSWTSGAALIIADSRPVVLSLTEHFGALSALNRLDISGNALVSLPASFANLSGLRSLSIDGNLWGTPVPPNLIPKAICNITNLQIYDSALDGCGGEASLSPDLFADREALLGLSQAPAVYSWVNGSSPCQWTGVVCDIAGGRVTALDLCEANYLTTANHSSCRASSPARCALYHRCLSSAEPAIATKCFAKFMAALGPDFQTKFSAVQSLIVAEEQ